MRKVDEDQNKIDAARNNTTSSLHTLYEEARLIAVDNHLLRGVLQDLIDITERVLELHCGNKLHSTMVNPEIGAAYKAANNAKAVLTREA